MAAPLKMTEAARCCAAVVGIHASFKEVVSGDGAAPRNCEIKVVYCEFRNVNFAVFLLARVDA